MGGRGDQARALCGVRGGDSEAETGAPRRTLCEVRGTDWEARLALLKKLACAETEWAERHSSIVCLGEPPRPI